MIRKDQNGNVPWAVIIMLLVVTLISTTLFAIKTWDDKQEYKNNVDKIVVAAVDKAKADQNNQLEKAFAEKEKLPNKTYKGPVTYGTITFDYPKTWSAYVDEASTNQPINGYFHPGVIPGLQSTAAYALRVELSNQDYSTVLKQYDTTIKDGSLKAAAYVPPKMAGVANVQPGTKLDGKLDQDTNGSMVIIKVRDKTLKIYSESNDFFNDFNNPILASLTFAP
ncbi:hypothetical protein HYW36_03090 [Candidatus Saccharibacteria bacterium]|nr:hypothetical protein [Candidatus Saccharibacteria bacterium]